MAIRDFYDFEKPGLIFSKTSNARVFLVASRSWGEMEARLFEKFSSGAAVMLDEMGYSYGMGLAKEGKKYYSDPAKLIGAVRNLGNVSGWGTFEVSGDLGTGRMLEITVRDCIFCEGRQPEAANSCQLLVGLIRGLTEVTFGSPFAVTETGCEGQKGGVCKFRAQRKQAPNDLGRRPYSSIAHGEALSRIL